MPNSTDPSSWPLAMERVDHLSRVGERNVINDFHHAGHFVDLNFRQPRDHFPKTWPGYPKGASSRRGHFESSAAEDFSFEILRSSGASLLLKDALCSPARILPLSSLMVADGTTEKPPAAMAMSFARASWAAA